MPTAADSPLPTAGYRMPAEWEPHAGTWIAWPHEREDWPGKFGPVPWVYAEIARHLSASEPTHILVQPDDAQSVRKLLRRTTAVPKRVQCWPCKTDRVWTRDSGPIFVTNAEGKILITHWRFNAWAKYDNWTHDAELPRHIGHWLGIPVVQPTLRGQRAVLEGGSIDVNGQGLLLTTEECLLSEVQERNPGFGREDYEQLFRDYLGVQKVLWLNKGIAGDDTHGHVDDLARFVNPTTIVTVLEKRKADENYAPTHENLERLHGMTDQHGQALQIVTLPMPAPVIFHGQRLPASYANFYIANDRVLVPTFNDPQDRIALGILADLFPGRQVVGIHSVDLVFGLGTLHCLTQQQPQPVRAAN